MKKQRPWTGKQAGSKFTRKQLLTCVWNKTPAKDRQINRNRPGWTYHVDGGHQVMLPDVKVRAILEELSTSRLMELCGKDRR